MDAELAWKRRMARLYPFGRWVAIPLFVVAISAIGSWWLAARVWLTAYRPELAGVSSNSDAGPQPGVEFVSAFLVAVGIGLAALLVMARRYPPAARWIVATVIAAGLTLSCVLVVRAQSEDRCSVDHYTGTATCVSKRQATWVDLGPLLIPGALTLSSLASGALLERRRATHSEPVGSG